MMPQVPPLPSWDALHPLIIHFPIVLLLLTPLFILISAVLPPPRGRPYMVAAMLVLFLGNGSLFLATSTGKAAGELARRNYPTNAVLELHQHLATETELIFSELSLILLAIVFLPRSPRGQETRLFSTLLPLTFLAFYSVGILFLVSTAHNGSRLVHEFGVHSLAFANREHAVISRVMTHNVVGATQHSSLVRTRKVGGPGCTVKKEY